MGRGERRREIQDREERGTTLIEVMISLVVFSVGALGLLTLIYTSHQGVTAAEKITHATALARGKLDELVRLPYDDADLALNAEGCNSCNDCATHEDGTKNLKSDGSVAGDYYSDDTWFARCWNVEEPTTNLKTIAVRVRWWDHNYKQSREVVMQGARSGP